MTARSLQRAIVEEVIVDGQGQATMPASQGVVLAPGSRHVELHYTSPSLSAPGRVRFRYRLDGYDPTWVEAGTRRVANYADLPPGAHRFRVAAAIDDGALELHGDDARVAGRPALLPDLVVRRYVRPDPGDR